MTTTLALLTLRQALEAEAEPAGWDLDVLLRRLARDLPDHLLDDVAQLARCAASGWAW